MAAEQYNTHISDHSSVWHWGWKWWVGCFGLCLLVACCLVFVSGLLVVLFILVVYLVGCFVLWFCVDCFGLYFCCRLIHFQVSLLSILISWFVHELFVEDLVSCLVNNFVRNCVVDCCIFIVLYLCCVDCFGFVVDCVVFCCWGLADELGHAPH